VKFSLVLATVGRTEELERFLVSLDTQTYRDFELIVVDQNEDNRIVPILSRFSSSFPILHLKPSEKGASKARNLGISHAQGDIIAFPDDDCVYSPNLLEGVKDFFEQRPDVDLLIVRATGLDGKSFSLQPHREGKVSFWQIWHISITWTSFARRFVTEKVVFDEKIGPGTFWSSGDDTDFGINALKEGFSVWYEPSLVVNHPNQPPSLDKALRYGRGNGYLLRKHRAWLKFLWILARRGVAIPFFLLTLRPEEAVWRWAALRGTLEGFFAGGRR